MIFEGCRFINSGDSSVVYFKSAYTDFYMYKLIMRDVTRDIMRADFQIVISHWQGESWG